MEDANQKTLLVTGGALRIGAAIAEHCASLGWNVVIHSHRSGDEAETLAAAFRKKYKISVTLKSADLRDTTALADFWKGLPPVTALVHNAAIFERDTLASLSASSLGAHLAINFTAPLILTQGFMKQLPKDAKGSVTILGDGVMGWSISPEFFSYSVSKQAWLGALDVLAAACAPRARVNLLALAPTLPGPGDTPEMFVRLAEQAPLKRTGSPEEVAQAVSYLLTADSITGEVISLANGAHLRSARS